jgi:cytoskeletal protein CcmA (bactofilin family)
LNRITKLTPITSGIGSGYGTGLFLEEVFYNAQLVGSTTGEGATAVVRVNSGAITDIRLMDGGSGYQKDQVLSIVGIATTTGFFPAGIGVSEIYNNIDSNFRVEGIFAPPFNNYNGVYRITSVPSSRKIEVVSEGPKFADIPAVGQIPIISVNPTGLANINSDILRFGVCATSGEAITVTSFSYNPTTGIAVITTPNSNGFKIDNKVVISGFINPLTSLFSEDFNGEFFVKKINSVTQFEIFVGTGIQTPVVILGQEYLNRPGFGAAGGQLTTDNEETAGRLSPRYGGLTTTLSVAVNSTDNEINLNDLDELDLKLGDYLLIDYEIMRISEDVSTNPLDSVKVFRGLLGTLRRPHVINSYVEKINVFPIEFRRNSVIRASGHTFEYVGYGPGNYSTTLPERQDRSLSKSEETLAQSFKLDGGVNAYTGMNDSGSFYIGNRRIISTTGKEEIFDAPIPTITGEDPTGSGNFGFDLIVPDEIRVSRSIRVEGGADSNIISQFDGPVIINNKLSSTKNIEAGSLSLKGSTNVSRNYTVGISTPLLSGNPGDVVFDANPEDGEYLGWIYTTSNHWNKFGLIQDNNGFYDGNFTGTFVGDASGLTGVSDIWTVDSNGIFFEGNVGIATTQSLPNFALHIFGGIKANGISEFNSQQLTFNIPSLLNFNAVTTRVSQSFDVLGSSTFSNNISVGTTINDTNGRHLRFIQTDTTIANDQGYGGIEWEGFDTGNSELRGYIRGISEGTQGQFGISFATQGSGASNPIERLRISSSGNSVFKNPVIGEQGFIGNLTGVASTATNATLSRVNPDTSNTDRFVTFVGGNTDDFYNQRSSNNLKFNPFTGTLTATNFSTSGELNVNGNLSISGIITCSGNAIFNGLTTIKKVSDIYTNLSTSGSILTCNFDDGPITRTTSTNTTIINITNVPTTDARALNHTVIINSATTVSNLANIQFQINGTALNTGGNSIRWLNNLPPSGIAAGYYFFGFSIFRVGSVWEVLAVFATYG